MNKKVVAMFKFLEDAGKQPIPYSWINYAAGQPIRTIDVKQVEKNPLSFMQVVAATKNYKDLDYIKNILREEGHLETFKRLVIVSAMYGADTNLLDYYHKLPPSYFQLSWMVPLPVEPMYQLAEIADYNKKVYNFLWQLYELFFNDIDKSSNLKIAQLVLPYMSSKKLFSKILTTIPSDCFYYLFDEMWDILNLSKKKQHAKYLDQLKSFLLIAKKNGADVLNYSIQLFEDFPSEGGNFEAFKNFIYFLYENDLISERILHQMSYKQDLSQFTPQSKYAVAIQKEQALFAEIIKKMQNK